MINLELLQSLRTESNGFFRFKKLDEKTYIITDDVGKYSYLTYEEFGNFISGNLKSGEKYEELKEKGFIKVPSSASEDSKSYLIKNSFVGLGPTLHILVTTLRCNHACSYCHASVTGENDMQYDMSIDTARKVVDTIFYTNAESLTIEFQGGESLLNFEVIKFVTEYAKQKAVVLHKNVSFALVSNLTLIDDEKLEYITSQNIGISTSLDGDEETHNFNRIYKKGNSYKEVISKIQQINNFYKEHQLQSKVGALLTVTRRTLSKSKEIVNSYISVGLEGIYLRPLNPYGFAEKKMDQIGYTDEEFLEFYRRTLDYIIEINKKGVIFKEHYTTIFLLKILTDTDPNFLDSRSPCGACIGQVAYNYDGNIFSCDEGRMFTRMGDSSFQIGQVSDNPRETYESMMGNEVTKVMVQASTLDGLPGYNEHVYKPYLGVCPISSYKATGSIVPNFTKDGRTKIDIGIIDYIFEKVRDEEVKKIFEIWIGKKTVLDLLQC